MRSVADGRKTRGTSSGATARTVAGTPAFFFNGLLRAGPMTIQRLDEILEPLLAEAAGE